MKVFVQTALNMVLLAATSSVVCAQNMTRPDALELLKLSFDCILPSESIDGKARVLYRQTYSGSESKYSISMLHQTIAIDRAGRETLSQRSSSTTFFYKDISDVTQLRASSRTIRVTCRREADCIRSSEGPGGFPNMTIDFCDADTAANAVSAIKILTRPVR